MGDPVLGVALFVTLLLLAPTQAAGPGATPSTLLDTLDLGLGVHALATLYNGRFGPGRTLTWVALVVGMALMVATGFLGYLLPWGQVSFWLMDQAFNLFGSATTTIAAILQPIPSLALVVVLGLDIILLHRRHVARWGIGRTALFSAALVLAAAALPVLTGVDPGAPAAASPPLLPTPAQIVPSLALSPWFALLRCLPDKRGGLALLGFAMLLPLLWPWQRLDRLRGPLRRAAWAGLCLVVAGCWLGLTWLGTQAPDPAVIAGSRALAVGLVASLLLGPILLHRLPSAAPQRSSPMPDQISDPEAIIDAMGPLLGLVIEPEYRPAIAVNLKVTAAMAALVLEAPIEDEAEPAPVFRA